MTHITTGGIVTPPSHLLPLLTAEVISDGEADLLQASGLYEYEPVWIGGRGYVGCLWPQRMGPNAARFRQTNLETWIRIQ